MSIVNWVAAMVADGHTIVQVEAEQSVCQRIVESGLLPGAAMLPERVFGRVVLTTHDGAEWSAVASQ